MKPLLCLLPALFIPALAPAQNLLTNGDFETTPFDQDWTSSGVTLFGGFAPGSLQSAALSTSGSGRIGQDTPAATGNWSMDAWFAIKPTANRAFSLLVNQTGNASIVNVATINIRCQSGILETFSSATNSWTSLGLGTVAGSVDANNDGDLDDPGDTRNVYHLRLTGNAWGTPDSSFDVQLSEPNAAALTRQAAGLSRYQNGNGDNGPPSSFVFNTAFGSNPGFWVDDVSFENISIPDDPNLGVPTALPLFGTLEVDSGPVTRVITLQNTGAAADLTVSSATLAGADASRYAVLTALPLTIPPGSSQDLEITFTPGTERRSFSATLNLASNDPGSAILPVPLPATVHAFGAPLIADGSFDLTPFPTPWITTGTVTAAPGLRAPSVTAAALSAPGAGGVNSTAGLAVNAPSDWRLSFDFLITSTAGRAFQLLVHSFGEPNRLDGAPLNFRVENGVPGFLTEATWTDLTPWPLQASLDANGDGDFEDAGDSKSVYRLQLTGRHWGSPEASYDAALTDADSPVFTRAFQGWTSFVTGQGNPRTSLPSAFLFCSATAGSAAFMVDNVTFTAGAPPPAPIFAPAQITLNGTALTLSWDPLPYASYTIWTSQDLSHWTEAESNTPGPAYEEQFIIPGRRFFRVEQK